MLKSERHVAHYVQDSDVIICLLRMAEDWQLYEIETQMDIWAALQSCAHELSRAQAPLQKSVKGFQRIRDMVDRLLAEECGPGGDSEDSAKERTKALHSLMLAIGT